MLTVADFAPHTNAMVAQLIRLVEIESPSTDKQAVDRLGQVVAQVAGSLGAAVTTEPRAAVGDPVVARWGAASGAGSAAPIVLLCHLDTVYPVGTLARTPVREAAGLLRGPGTFDMKASTVIALTAVAQLRERGLWPTRPVTALFTTDEEIGSDHSRALIEQHARGAALVLCLEPALPDGSLKTWRKGVGDFTLVAHGRAAHAGADHERGRNAIEELAHHVLAAQALTDYQAGTTVNVGVIEGGTRSNVVPERARAHIDMRVLAPAEAERIAAWMFSRQPVLEGTRLEVTGGLNRPPMPRNALMAATFEKAQQIGAQVGLALTEGGTGGGSDANFVAPLGVPVLDGLGPRGNGAHSEREHIVIASLAERAALVAGLLTGW
jgi:glutamate carboxypeptidase